MNNIIYQVKKNVAKRKDGFNPVTSEKGYSKITFELDNDWEKCDIVTANFFVSADDVVKSEAQLMDNMTVSFDVPTRLRNTSGKIFCGIVGTYDDNGNNVTISTQIITLNALFGIKVVEDAPMNLYEQIIGLVNKIDNRKADLSYVNALIQELKNIISYTKQQIEGKLEEKQDTKNIVNDIRYITDAKKNYPSISYLDSYYYDAEGTDSLLDDKADKTEVDTAIETIGKALDETTQTANSVSEIINQELKSEKEINKTETHTTTPFVCVAYEFKKGLSYTIEYNASASVSSIASTLTKSISSSQVVDTIATGNLQNGIVTFSPTSDGAKYLTFKGISGAEGEQIALTITGKITSSLLGKTTELDDSVNNIEEVINSKVYSDNQFSGSHGSGFVTFPFKFETGKQYKISYKSLNDGLVTFMYNQTANNINGSSRVDIIATPNVKEGEVYYTPSSDGGKYLAFRCDSDLVNIECKVTFSINENIGMIKEDVKTLKDDVETLKNDKDPAEIPEYYYENNYIDGKIQTIKEKSSYKHGVSFVFISDLHFLQNQNQSKKLIKKILDETNVPFVLCGGDLIYLTGTQEQLDEQIAEFNEFKSFIGKDRLFCTRGNHELYNQTGTGAEAERHDYTNGTVYDLLLRDNESRVTNMSIKNMCYCIDNDTQKTRIVMLNTSDMTSDVSSTAGGIMFRGSTLEWLKNALTEKDNYNIIIVSHHHINSENFVNQAGYMLDEEINYDFKGESPYALFDLVKAFKERTTFSATQFNVTCEADFTNNTNNLICIVSGHRHKDRYSEQNGILNILTTCDCIDTKDDYNRNNAVGTIKEQAFDVYNIDFDQEKIYLTRIGAGKDRHFNCTANKNLFDKITPIGNIGADGKSAYEIAVENGFNGTEAQWLASLKGSDGTNGEDGRDGQDYVLTDADKQEIANLSSDTIPDYIRTAAEKVANKVLSVTGEANTSGGTAYTNQLLNAIDENGNPYNGGKGYKTDYRLNSSGVEKNDYTGICCTGFISCKAGDIIRFKNITVASATVTPYIAKYDSNKAFVGVSSAVNDIVENSYTVSGGSTAYVRFSLGQITDESVITVNEEISEIVSGKTAKSVVPFNLAFITDLHYDDAQIGRYTAAKKAMDVINETAPIDVEIMGGDYCNNYTASTGGTATEAREDISNCRKIFSDSRRRLWLRGNHDSNGYPNERLLKAEIYNRIFRSQHTINGFVENPADPYGCYGYMDFDNAKIRLIVVNTSDNDSFGTATPEQSTHTAPMINSHNVGAKQLQWIADTALNFSGKDDVADWGVIFVSHVPIFNSNPWYNSHTYTDDNGKNWDCNLINLANLAVNYKNKTNFSCTNNGETVNKNFTKLTEQAKILCFISGHTHALTNTSYYGLNFISCPNSNGGANVSTNGISYAKSNIGSVGETALSVISVDRTNKKIHAFCYGAGYDREIEI